MNRRCIASLSLLSCIVVFASASASATQDSAMIGTSFLVEPMSTRDFLRDIWERRTLFQARGKTSSPLFSFGALDAMFTDIVSAVNISNDQLEVPKDGTIVKRVLGNDGEWWSAAVQKKSLVERDFRHGFKNGFTVVLNRVDRRSSNIALLARHLEKELGIPVQANIYLTPAGAQGFEHHFDPMETFVVQVEGKKRWRVLEPLIPIPRLEQKYKPKNSEIANLTLLHDVVINAGDMLYMPRGWVHEALTQSTDPSMHVTVGLDAQFYTWEAVGHVLVSQLPNVLNFDDQISPHCRLTYRHILHLRILATALTHRSLRSSFPLTSTTLNIFGPSRMVPFWREILSAIGSVAATDVMKTAAKYVAQESDDSILHSYIPKFPVDHFSSSCQVVDIENFLAASMSELSPESRFTHAAETFRKSTLKTVEKHQETRQTFLLRHKQRPVP